MKKKNDYDNSSDDIAKKAFKSTKMCFRKLLVQIV